MLGKNKKSFISTNSKKLWDTIKVMTNMNTKSNSLITNDDLRKANELNDVYLRFDTQDCTLEWREALKSLVTEDTSDRVIVDPQKVCLIFSQLY